MTRQIVSPDVKKRIIELARDRKSAAEIAADVKIDGLSAHYVSMLITRARRDGIIIPYRSRKWEQRRENFQGDLTSIEVTIGRNVVSYLKNMGERRGLTPEYMAGLLIEAIANDKIGDAVLDDGVTS